MYYYGINKFCIKLVIETSLHYDTRSEKHQIEIRLRQNERKKYYECVYWNEVNHERI